MKTISVAIVLTLLSALVASAAGPADTTPPSSRPSMRLTAQTGFGGTSETTISGMAVDRDGKPIGNVAAKLYVGGVLVSETVTDPDGGFEMVELIDYARDVTIDMWFVPEGVDMVMENVILKESTTAVQNALYSKCVSRVRLDPITDFVVRILDLESRTRMLKTSDCLG